MPDLSSIKHIVIVMLENRSFDHILGYRSLPPFSKSVEGLRTDAAWLATFTNEDQGRSIQSFLSDNPYTMPAEFDPPHERANVAANLGPLQNGTYPMTGFAGAIPTSISNDPDVRKLVMSYFGAAQVPISHFFAQNFTICDHWYSSLPAGTQPNRLMSMGGVSLIDVNHDILPAQDLIYDWLNQRGISWRVYHQGIPFFTMMLKWVPEILLTDHFRNFDDLENDLMNTPPDELPQVLFIEPTYQDAPHLGFSTDEHAPAGISSGQEFLMETYNAATNSPAFWNSTVMVVDYDEHGGFFDHVSPPLIPTVPPAGATYTQPFASLGVRIPAYVISPFVKPDAVNSSVFDHTSVLKFIAEKFGGGSYSAEVDARPVASLSAVLDFQSPITAPPSAPALDAYLAQRPPAPAGTTVPTPDTDLKKGFQNALASLQQNGAGATHPKFGALISNLPTAPPETVVP
jgi:phospholipase C